MKKNYNHKIRKSKQPKESCNSMVILPSKSSAVKTKNKQNKIKKLTE